MERDHCVVDKGLFLWARNGTNKKGRPPKFVLGPDGVPIPNLSSFAVEYKKDEHGKLILDLDGDVDSADFGRFQRCISGAALARSGLPELIGRQCGIYHPAGPSVMYCWAAAAA